MKNPLTPAGIEPATFRFVSQHLNHCATAVREFMCFVEITYKAGIYNHLDLTLCPWVGVSRRFNPNPQKFCCDDLKFLIIQTGIAFELMLSNKANDISDLTCSPR